MPSTLSPTSRPPHPTPVGAPTRLAGPPAPSPRVLQRLSGAIAVMAIAAGLAATAGTARAEQALDIGAPSVMSQQGQRLKVAVPYGSAPGERVPVLRFTVASISADGGASAPAAEDFVVSQPERRNVIFLQSREVVSAAHLKLVLAVAGPAPQQVTMDLQVPPPKAAPVESAALDQSARPAARAAGAKAVRSKAKRRESTGQPA